MAALYPEEPFAFWVCRGWDIIVSRAAANAAPALPASSLKPVLAIITDTPAWDLSSAAGLPDLLAWQPARIVVAGPIDPATQGEQYWSLMQSPSRPHRTLLIETANDRIAAWVTALSSAADQWGRRVSPEVIQGGSGAVTNAFYTFLARDAANARL